MGQQAKKQHLVRGKPPADFPVHRLNQLKGQQLHILRHLPLLLNLGLEGVIAHQMDADISALRFGQPDLEGLRQPPGDKAGRVHLLPGEFPVRREKFLADLMAVAQPENADGDVGGQGGEVFAAHEEVKFPLRLLNDAANLFDILLGVDLFHLFQPLFGQADGVGLAHGGGSPPLAKVEKARDGRAPGHLVPGDADAPALGFEQAQLILAQPVFRPVQVGQDDKAADIEAVRQKLDGQLLPGEDQAAQELHPSVRAAVGHGEVLVVEQRSEGLTVRSVHVQPDAVALLFYNADIGQLVLRQPSVRLVQIILHRALRDVQPLGQAAEGDETVSLQQCQQHLPHGLFGMAHTHLLFLLNVSAASGSALGRAPRPGYGH